MPEEPVEGTETGLVILLVVVVVQVAVEKGLVSQQVLQVPVVVLKLITILLPLKLLSSRPVKKQELLVNVGFVTAKNQPPSPRTN